MTNSMSALLVHVDNTVLATDTLQADMDADALVTGVDPFVVGLDIVRAEQDPADLAIEAAIGAQATADIENPRAVGQRGPGQASGEVIDEFGIAHSGTIAKAGVFVQRCAGATLCTNSVHKIGARWIWITTMVH